MKKITLLLAIIVTSVCSAFAQRPAGLYLSLDDNELERTIAVDEPVTITVDATAAADIELYVGDVTGRPVALGRHVRRLDGKLKFDKPGEYVIIAYARGSRGAQAIASERVTVEQIQTDSAPRLTADAR